MYHLKLCKAKSYMGIVCATESKPDVYVPEKQQADKLVASGYFVLVSEEENTTNEIVREEVSKVEDTEPESLFEEPDEGGEDSPLVELQTKSKAELVEYANKNGIDLTGCNKKDEIYSQIIESIARADSVRDMLRKG